MLSDSYFMSPEIPSCIICHYYQSPDFYGISLEISVCIVCHKYQLKFCLKNSSKGVYGDIIRINRIYSHLMPFYFKILTPSSTDYNSRE